MVLHLRPHWRHDEALAENTNALGSLHAALDVQDSAGAWKLQPAEALIREGAHDMHHAITFLSCHTSLCAGAAQAEPRGPCFEPNSLSQNGYRLLLIMLGDLFNARNFQCA